MKNRHVLAKLSKIGKIRYAKRARVTPQNLRDAATLIRSGWTRTALYKQNHRLDENGEWVKQDCYCAVGAVGQAKGFDINIKDSSNGDAAYALFDEDYQMSRLGRGAWLTRKSKTQQALLKTFLDPYRHIYKDETGKDMTDEQVEKFMNGGFGSHSFYRVNDGQAYFTDYPGIEQYATHGEFIAALFDEAADLAEAS